MSDAHLSTTELVRWRDDGAGDRDRIVGHLAVCAVCRHAAAELEQERPADVAPSRFDPKEFVPAGYRAGARPAAPKTFTRLVYVAAAAVVVMAAVLVPAWLRDRADSTVRGGDTAVVLVRPVDATVALSDLAFEWKAEPGFERFRLTVVAVADPGKPVIDREVTATRYVPTDDERRRLSSGQSLHWFVEYRNAAGVVGTSPSARFTLR
jgi:hypothetical protein